MQKQKVATSSFWALVIAYILWGINTPVIKLGLRTVPLPLYLSVTIMGAALLIAPFAFKAWKPLKRSDYALLIIGALIAIPLGNVVLLMGLERIPAVNVTLIGLFSPLLLFILSVQFLKERLSLRTFLGILIAFAGAAIVIGKPWQTTGTSQTQLIGSLLIVLAVLCDVIATLIYKPALKKAGAYQMAFIQLFFGTLPIVIYSLKYLSNTQSLHIGRTGFLAMIFNIVAITIANCFFMYGLKHRKAQDIAVFQYIHPIVTAIAAWFILAEIPNAKLILGAAVIFIGIYLAEARVPRKIQLVWRHNR